MATNKEIYQILAEKLGKGRVKINEPLSLHTTFQIGGPSDYFYVANSSDELEKAIRLANDLNLSFYVVGGGSNILVGDRGFRGLVIKNKTSSIKLLSFKGKIKNKQSTIDHILVEAESGVPFNKLVRFTIDEGLEGLEEFLGLPGTVGGAVAVGAHWFDKRVPDLVVSRKIINNIFMSVVFKLKRADSKTLWQIGCQSVERRQKKHPLGMPSAGCIFQNIKKSEAALIGTPKMICSAGFLIEGAGLKGLKVGQVQISPHHANFIVNLGGGKAQDVLELIKIIKQKVKEKFKVQLHEEIIKVGEF